MTVRDLIAALQLCDQDLPVYYNDNEYGHVPVDRARATAIELDRRWDRQRRQYVSKATSPGVLLD